MKDKKIKKIDEFLDTDNNFDKLIDFDKLEIDDREISHEESERRRNECNAITRQRLNESNSKGGFGVMTDERFEKIILNIKKGGDITDERVDELHIKFFGVPYFKK